MTCFTAEQQQFIQHQNGNAVCIAGAGTGKTTTLVGLIKQKLETVASENIMVLMFNKDIRTDFKAKLVESGVQQAVPVHTFHSFCLKFLNHTGYLRETGFTAEFNQGEQDKRFVTQILRSIAGGEKSYQRQQLIKDPKTIELVMNFIGLVKAYMLPANEVFALTDISEEYRFIISAYHDFEVIRKQHKVLFFDDWLVETVKVLKQSPEIQAYYQHQCQLLIVDEFQDINNAQYALLKALLGDNSQLIAVGDVDQCIYKWRGSAPQFMLNFEQDFKPATTYTLSKTFRFGHSLALAAGHLIANNNERFHDFVTISNEEQSDTQVAVTGSGRQVGEIAQAIQTHLNNGVAPNDIAILVRRWSQALLFELAFLSKQIPFQMPIPSVLSHCREVRLLMELMGFVTGRFRDYPQQYKSNVLFNLMSFPHCYIPNKLLQPFCNELAALPVSQWRSHAVKLEKIHESVKFDSFIDRVELLAQLEPKGSFKAVEVYRQYRKQSFLDNWIWKTEATSTEIEEALERLDSIETVLETMDQPCEKALQYFEYYSNQSQQHQQTSKSDSVQLTTIFRAKGCEYQHVFLPYWDKDAFPYVNRAASSIAADTEEERRLAYVAITRAKQSAHIFYTTEHNKESLRQCASQFVLEAKTNIAAEAGSALYQEGELPYFRSTLLEQYYDKLGRLEDMVKPELPMVVEKSFSSEGYSYGWALTQPLPANAEKVIRSMVKTKTRKYLDGELTRILRELANASETKKKVLENRLIVVARAKERK
ncbi:DNA helicase UvrD [Photobacterium jeanii]|uniref:DNA 3'-5' helicase n=1 Tax=Photobacterium jeanii TaxID=858640 RepID=A0A178KK86_9GAMM|nr:ATP-dependent helicase [Photobacterium jeanii]OAN17651.1 DNA helicase UvrD [Photobacterium jeanii]PST92692.1 ATP-dependent helicase [Photobacterium jeanii]